MSGSMMLRKAQKYEIQKNILSGHVNIVDSHVCFWVVDSEWCLSHLCRNNKNIFYINSKNVPPMSSIYSKTYCARKKNKQGTYQRW